MMTIFSTQSHDTGQAVKGCDLITEPQAQSCRSLREVRATGVDFYFEFPQPVTIPPLLQTNLLLFPQVLPGPSQAKHYASPAQYLAGYKVRKLVTILVQ
jgi:hypothetical protein